MFMQAYKQAFSVLAKKPLRLWGLSLLSGLVCAFAALLTFPFLGIVGAGFSIVVGAGMNKVYLDALDNKEVNSDQLFAGFKRLWTVLGGMAWTALWIFIWGVAAGALAAVVIAIFGIIAASIRVAALGIIGVALGVIAGIAGGILVLYKSYSYSFVPYILMTREDVSATQALRLSMQLTKGKRIHMFLADLLFGICASVIFGILAALAMIPYAGWIFGIVLVAFAIVYVLLQGIFQGLYRAAFYKMPAVDSPAEDKFEAKFNEFAQKAQNVSIPMPGQAAPQQQPQQQYQAPQQPQQFQAPQQQPGYQPRIVYCRQCGAAYDANLGGCPNGHQN